MPPALGQGCGPTPPQRAAPVICPGLPGLLGLPGLRAGQNHRPPGNTGGGAAPCKAPPLPWCPEGRGLGGFAGPGRREGACHMSPREPRTPHAISSHSVPTTGLATGHISQTGTLRSQGLSRSRDTQHTGLRHSPHSAPATGLPGEEAAPYPLRPARPDWLPAALHPTTLPQAAPGCSGSHSRPGPSSHNAGAPGTASHTWRRRSAGEGGEGQGWQSRSRSHLPGRRQ